jgi:hypothetical protein
MSPRNTLMLVFSLFLCLTTGGMAVAETPRNEQSFKFLPPPWSEIRGFRSARFGMAEKQLMRAIAKDFKIKKNNIERAVHPINETTSLSIKVSNIIAIGETVEISYILGYKSKKLAQINLRWAGEDEKKIQSVVGVANLLRNHFEKKRYKKDTHLINRKIDENQSIVFRGADKKGRMIVLLLITSSIENKVELRLSYMLEPYTPDLSDTTKGKF